MDRRTLGEYRIEGIVGAGRMGVVYLAMDPSGRKVALKVLRDDVGHRPRLPRALPPRGAHAGRPGPPPRHPDPRDGRDRRPALHRHPADVEHAARPDHARARSRVDDAIAILAAVADALDAAHARGRDPPRHQARQRPPRSRPARVPHRLRARARPVRLRPHRPRPGPRDDRLHGARAAGGRAHRARHRHLRAGVPGGRDAHRPGAVPARQRRRDDLRARHGRAAAACPSAAPSSRSPSTRSSPSAWPSRPTTVPPRPARSSPTCCVRWTGRSPPGSSRPAEAGEASRCRRRRSRPSRLRGRRSTAATRSSPRSPAARWAPSTARWTARRAARSPSSACSTSATPRASRSRRACWPA